jgi:SPP1 family phage portal protein
MFGRRPIYTAAKEITRDNVMEELTNALNVHDMNRGEIQYLWDYYKGKQPVLDRVKEVRPEINNKVVVNIAYEAVSFAVAYLCGEPMQYVSREGREEVADKVIKLNSYMFDIDKAALDQEVVEWMNICGTAYRLALPGDGVRLYTLDPRDTFVVYSAEIGHKPMMAVSYYQDSDLINHYSIYTETEFFVVENDLFVAGTYHGLGGIPIFEYPANAARMGLFERCLALLDAINTVESNRVDNVEAVVNAFIKFVNCDISPAEYDEFLKKGAIKVSSADGQNADVDMVSVVLDQSQSQTLKDDMYNAVLRICGMPAAGNPNAAASDTGQGVLLRNGWEHAEARAKDSEHQFKKAERPMLKRCLYYLREMGLLDLNSVDVDMKFTRRNYENIQSKAQVLDLMLNNPKIEPLLAFEHCGMFSDPEGAYKASMKAYEEYMRNWEPITSEGIDDEAVRENGRVSEES